MEGHSGRPVNLYTFEQIQFQITTTYFIVKSVLFIKSQYFLLTVQMKFCVFTINS